jgi:hypothetical protein
MTIVADAHLTRDGSFSVAGLQMAHDQRVADTAAVTMADARTWAERNRMKPTGNDARDLASINRMRALLKLPEFSVVRERVAADEPMPPSWEVEPGDAPPKRPLAMDSIKRATQPSIPIPSTAKQLSDEEILTDAARKAWAAHPSIPDESDRAAHIKSAIPASPWRRLMERHHAQFLDTAIRRLLSDVRGEVHEIVVNGQKPGRGRPPTREGGKLQSEIQRAYRTRLKAAGKVVATVSRVELVLIRQVPIGQCTAGEVREWIEDAKASGRISMTNALFGEFLIKDLPDDDVIGRRWHGRDAEVSAAWMAAFQATQRAFEQVEASDA